GSRGGRTRLLWRQPRGAGDAPPPLPPAAADGLVLRARLRAPLGLGAGATVRLRDARRSARHRRRCPLLAAAAGVDPLGRRRPDPARVQRGLFPPAPAPGLRR